MGGKNSSFAAFHRGNFPSLKQIGYFFDAPLAAFEGFPALLVGQTDFSGQRSEPQIGGILPEREPALRPAV